MFLRVCRLVDSRRTIGEMMTEEGRTAKRDTRSLIWVALLVLSLTINAVLILRQVAPLAALHQEREGGYLSKSLL